MTRHRSALLRVLRAGLHIVLIAVVLALAGATYGAYHEGRQRSQFPPPGQLVDIGDGRLIHLRTWGEHVPGRPTVVLDVSAQVPSSAFAWIAQDLASSYRVVAYDRPGMGWSRGGGGPRDARGAAEVLRAALWAAGIDPPYIVVAHSFGGLSARVFTSTYRNEVVALVLLDTTHTDGRGGTLYATYARLRALAGHMGLWQLVPRGPDDMASLPPDEATAAQAVGLWTSHLDASADELEAWDLSIGQARAASGFADLPLLVVAAAASEGQYAKQRDIARLSSTSEYVELRHVGHIQMLTDPAQAAEIAGYIRRFLRQASGGSAGVLQPGGDAADGQVDEP